MDPQLKKTLDTARDGMSKSLEHLEDELHKIRAGRAQPVMLDGVRVDYYGTPTPLNQVGNVAAPDARTLTIQPFEKKMIAVIEKAINEANLGLNPQNDGIIIRLNVPAPTEERRKQLVKQAKEECEQAKIAIRKIRQHANDELKKLQKGGVSEDETKAAEAELQKITNNATSKSDEILSKKEAEVMHV